MQIKQRSTIMPLSQDILDLPAAVVLITISCVDFALTWHDLMIFIISAVCTFVCAFWLKAVLCSLFISSRNSLSLRMSWRKTRRTCRCRWNFWSCRENSWSWSQRTMLTKVSGLKSSLQAQMVKLYFSIVFCPSPSKYHPLLLVLFKDWKTHLPKTMTRLSWIRFIYLFKFRCITCNKVICLFVSHKVGGKRVWHEERIQRSAPAPHWGKRQEK